MINLPLGRKFKLGLIVNPYAGIGGALALKGSDGQDVRAKALAQGASQQAMHKTFLALTECEKALAEYVNKSIGNFSCFSDYCEIYTGNADMGENTVERGSFSHKLVYRSAQQTEMQDTIALAQALITHKVDLILFAGGDGTARNVCEVVSTNIPVLGVPAGCKIHSGVYAITPKAAGKVLAQVIQGELLSVQNVEVRDIDEALFRQGKVVAKHFGEMQVPLELSYIQAVKMGGKESDELLLDDMAEYVMEIMQDFDEHYFVMGSGSTVDAIMKHAGLKNTLLGVDIVHQGAVLAQDVTAEQLLNITKNKKVKLVITLIGGQGHIFGRGNQQLSPPFIGSISKTDILVVATKNKLQAMGNKGLICDTGDASLDASLAGPISVITGYRDHVLYFVRADD